MVLTPPPIRFSAQLELAAPAATDELGARLLGPLAACARRSPDGALVALSGPLGSGKSALCRALLRAAGVAGPIPSPTFTLLEPYQVGGLSFAHLDLYRLGDPDELALLGFDELRQAGQIVLLEWASRMPSLLAQAQLVVELEYQGEGRTAGLASRDSNLAQSLAHSGIAGRP